MKNLKITSTWVAYSTTRPQRKTSSKPSSRVIKPVCAHLLPAQLQMLPPWFAIERRRRCVVHGSYPASSIQLHVGWKGNEPTISPPFLSVSRSPSASSCTARCARWMVIVESGSSIIYRSSIIILVGSKMIIIAHLPDRHQHHSWTDRIYSLPFFYLAIDFSALPPHSPAKVFDRVAAPCYYPQNN